MSTTATDWVQENMTKSEESCAICGPQAEKVWYQLTPDPVALRRLVVYLYLLPPYRQPPFLFKISLTADYRIQMLYANMTSDIKQK